MRLRGPLRAADNDTVGLGVILEEVSGPLVVLHGQLAGRGDDKDARALFRCELRFV